jgi:hypothetical protein
MSNFYPENHSVYEIKMEEYGTARQAIDGHILLPMRFVSRIIKDRNM